MVSLRRPSGRVAAVVLALAEEPARWRYGYELCQRLDLEAGGLYPALMPLAAAVGRSFRSGLWACAWAVVLSVPLLIAAWLAEALRWYEQGRGMLLDGDGAPGVGVNLGDGVWWLLIFLVLWALPLGVLGAADGPAHARKPSLSGTRY